MTDTNEDVGFPPLKVLFLAAEAAPLIKVGGLGDVAGSLPPALRKLDPGQCGGRRLDVRLVIPFHGEIKRRLPELESVADFLVERPGGGIQAIAYYAEIDELPVYLIDGPPFQPDAPVYSLDAEADGDKFVFFSLAALELARQLDWQPDIVHANDWHTAISLYALCLQRGKDPFYERTRTVISIHNLPFMGAGIEKVLAEYGIPPAHTRWLPPWARSFPLPMGLLGADRILTVSSAYAEEILTPEFGCGLQDYLNNRKEDVAGILNGLDTAEWDPSTDRSLARPFDKDSLDQRVENKTALQEEVGLPLDKNVPLLVFIGRMDPQKGVDLAIDGLRLSADLPWQAVFLGTGVPLLESAARSLEVEFPDRVRAVIRFDSGLARHLYAGGDILLMPSRYEPCGLAQMIAMRYGCVPLGRATGGLRDTILDAGVHSPGTGFLFDDATPESFAAALKRAIKHFRLRAEWRQIQQAGMQQDFSWQQSAIKYAHHYREILGSQS